MGCREADDTGLVWKYWMNAVSLLNFFTVVFQLLKIQTRTKDGILHKYCLLLTTMLIIKRTFCSAILFLYHEESVEAFSVVVQMAALVFNTE